MYIRCMLKAIQKWAKKPQSTIVTKKIKKLVSIRKDINPINKKFK